MEKDGAADLDHDGILRAARAYWGGTTVRARLQLGATEVRPDLCYRATKLLSCLDSIECGEAVPALACGEVGAQALNDPLVQFRRATKPPCVGNGQGFLHELFAGGVDDARAGSRLVEYVISGLCSKCQLMYIEQHDSEEMSSGDVEVSSEDAYESPTVSAQHGAPFSANGSCANGSWHVLQPRPLHSPPSTCPCACPKPTPLGPCPNAAEPDGTGMCDLCWAVDCQHGCACVCPFDGTCARAPPRTTGQALRQLGVAYSSNAMRDGPRNAESSQACASTAAPCAVEARDGNRDINRSAPPWSVLLDTGMPLGATTRWTPRDMLRLRGTCHALRGSHFSTKLFLVDVLAHALDVRALPEQSYRLLPSEQLSDRSTPRTVQLRERSFEDLAQLANRVFAERCFLRALPSAVQEVITAYFAQEGVPQWLPETTAPPPAAVVAGGHALQRLLLRDSIESPPDWCSDDYDVFIPYGEYGLATAVRDAVATTAANHLPTIMRGAPEFIGEVFHVEQTDSEEYDNWKPTEHVVHAEPTVQRVPVLTIEEDGPDSSRTFGLDEALDVMGGFSAKHLCDLRGDLVTPNIIMGRRKPYNIVHVYV